MPCFSHASLISCSGVTLRRSDKPALDYKNLDSLQTSPFKGASSLDLTRLHHTFPVHAMFSPARQPGTDIDATIVMNYGDDVPFIVRRVKTYKVMSLLFWSPGSAFCPAIDIKVAGGHCVRPA